MRWIVGLFVVLAASASVDPCRALTKKSETDERKEKQEKGIRDFAGLSFGVGIGLTTDREGGPEIENAEIVNGVVRVTEEQEDVPRIMLETHYFFIPKRTFLRAVEVGKWGWGPFIGIQSGEEETIRALAAGLMIGFRKGEDAKNSWNFGVGRMFETNVKHLGSGIRENEPLPNGETAIRFRTESEQAIGLVWSFAWSGGKNGN